MNLLSIFPIFLVFAVLYKCQYKKEASSELLGLKSSNELKSIAAIVVVLHHLSQRVEYSHLLHPFIHFGTYAVSIFLFVSGFGLMKSHMQNENYTKGFLWKRIGKLLIPFTIANLVFWLLNLVQGNFISLSDFFRMLINGEDLVDNAWYIYVAIFLYLLFYISMKIFKKNYPFFILFNCIFTYLLAIFFVQLDFGGWWYVELPTFVLGVVFAVYEKQLVKVFNKYRWIIFVVCSILFICLYVNRDYMKPFDYENKNVVENILFILVILCVVGKFSFGNFILDFTGKYNLEIYLSHGFVYEILRSKFIYVDNNFLWVLLTLILTPIVSYLFHSLISYTYALLEKE